MAKDSIHHFSQGDFRAYVKTIADKSIVVPDAFETFREARYVPSRFNQMTIQELSDSPQLMKELYQALKRMAPESKFKLPYNKDQRKKDLINNIAESYRIDKDKAQCRIVTGQHNDSDRAYNYALEIVLVPRTDLGADAAGQVEIIGNVNDTPSIEGGESYFDGASYKWTDRKGKEMSEYSLRGILGQCGFTKYAAASKKKLPSICYVNLKTPVPDWMGSAGKTKINISPYSKDIAETLSSLAKKIPSYHGMTNSLGYEYYREYKKTATDYLRDFIRERKEVVGADPSLKPRDRITQSGVWYRTRPKMISEGFQPEISWGKTRRSFTSSIKRMCEEEFGIDREDLGIVASARAIMFYDGEQIPVDIDSIQTLATKGIAVIFVEKEGIPQVLADEARKYGIAIVNTRGRLTEYGQELIDAVVGHGSIAVILVDYDLVGDDIARRTGVPKIGITGDTITWLQQNVYAGLTEAQVEEAYEPPPGISTDEEYLKHKRIELDAIVALPEIGPQGLWKYIMFQLQKPEFSPNGFDIIDEVDIPADEAFYPEVLHQIRNFLDRHIDQSHKDELADIKDELTCVRELRELKDVEEEILQRLGGLVAKDKRMKKITSILNRALAELEHG